MPDLLKRQREDDQKKEQNRRLDFLKKIIYPFILAESTNVEDALIFCQTFTEAATTSFNKVRSETKISNLKLEDGLRHTDKAERYKKFIELVNNESVAAITDILIFFRNNVETAVREGLKDKKIEELGLEL